MAVDSNVAPIIIKRKKVSGGGGHHGGAWKVAYADFVTAMMAFFLLMWLLNATTEKQRKGLADYFTPTVAIARVSGGGDGALGGHSMFSEEVMPQVGSGATSLRAMAQRQASGALAPGQQAGEGGESVDPRGEDEALREIGQALMARSGESMVDDGLMRHIVTRVTDEGLVVELFETPDSPLFGADDQPTDLLRALGGVISRVSGMVTNPLAIEGHTAAYPLVMARDPSWEKSSARADNFRQMLLSDGMPKTRIDRVTAHADREPADSNPMDTRNNRIEVIFLRKS
ncbi:chemotaxis protein MotB [Salipiger aestuarii]|uniref:Chemotaxis protein MotB n=1 Tax=Salipiger aestuarii TaxID=568098 RepID=A0A327YK80_9RHOB|nr:flagellar motor protein MotB [Salipiger aestuarii]KAA8609842.1 chemotaxis protein MotB [Salipiger aestuarii]KAB2543102.1 chemotaxis protein MotB [Salipiger aestuarii]RAK21414.1 chemotaxis protein MotB [Salipiger aestuarii]